MCDGLWVARRRWNRIPHLTDQGPSNWHGLVAIDSRQYLLRPLQLVIRRCWRLFRSRRSGLVQIDLGRFRLHTHRQIANDQIGNHQSPIHLIHRPGHILRMLLNSLDCWDPTFFDSLRYVFEISS